MCSVGCEEALAFFQLAINDKNTFLLRIKVLGGGSGGVGVCSAVEP